ncbi:glycosyltransferase family 2 protein [Geobacter sp. AOG2]|uniref:glycosyltransferase family 2 protein n=1 Tax=Geobacter sp. AOG2 TaxID=1566347 RepID=UPI001CC685FE|nr:glycosyltransferase [Geobacter sp. AOG2]GFE59661.1 hypothetical protein AOG2_02490 [Geobacter sp. AOG2]
MVRISIAALIYKSTRFAEWLYDSIQEFTPQLQTGEAEFFFVANDPTDKLVTFLQQKGYPHYVNYNPPKTEEELFRLGYGAPEYIHRVYRGWNQAVLHAKGELVVLLNSDNYVSPDWLENLLKYMGRDKVVCSQLVERKHPKYDVFPGAYHAEFGSHPDNFDKPGFLNFVLRHKITGLRQAGAYMPCMFFKDQALQVGLYPEGNLAGSSFNDVTGYGDDVFFKRLAQIGVQHVTALDSIVYHLKEGEMDYDVPDGQPNQQSNELFSSGLDHLAKAVACFYEAINLDPGIAAKSSEALKIVDVIKRYDALQKIKSDTYSGGR